MTTFEELFERATGHKPFPYQCRFALDEQVPSLVSVPTGLGKTAAAVIGWLWRRRYAPQEVRRSVPRRLVYCLPMRVLVEQTRDEAVRWLHRLGMLAGTVQVDTDGRIQPTSYDPWGDPNGGDSGIPVFLLLGGDVERDWDRLPDRDAILVGTQDMLLSRALMRGYAMSRFRWPVQFGLLHNDALWIFDEVQLMGSGLATSAQLQAFRRTMDARRSASVWMSATLRREWLETVDFDPERDAPVTLELGAADAEDPVIARRIGAAKRLTPAGVPDATKPAGVAGAVREAHRHGSRTLVVLNTVSRAVRVHDALDRSLRKAESSPRLVLIHSRFRPRDRDEALRALLSEPTDEGTIAVCTQVIEAGLDVSARVLFTDPAPWPSLIQRFGRCNRGGEHADAEIYWFDGPVKKLAGPYAVDAVQRACDRLRSSDSAALSHLPPVEESLSVGAVLRRQDLVDLFDTAPDLSGRDVDVSPYVREGADHSVFVFWRELPAAGPDAREGAPARDELCPVPVGVVRDRMRGGRFWRWDIHNGAWIRVGEPRELFPGLVLMAPCTQGDYDPVRGWLDTPNPRQPVQVVPQACKPESEEEAGGDRLSLTRSWRTIADHTNRVVVETEALVEALGDILAESDARELVLASRWHDRGKAHPVFQEALVDPPGTGPWAKSGSGMRRYARPGFRHELASALAMLGDELPGLAVYLVAAHHGRVRVTLRAWPDEPVPDNGQRFACGVWEGDELSETDLGGGVLAPRRRLRLSYAEIGCDPETGPSWTERVQGLVDQLGPFRLAWLEALLRVADWRGSTESADSHSPAQPQPEEVDHVH